ncbi:hypothetical protein JCM15519_05410 [Fundidesulfovibrio butyratiphilus]
MSIGSILVIVLIVLVLFGGKRLPDMGRLLGRTVAKLRDKTGRG